LLVDWPVDAEAPLTCAFVASESRCPPSLQPLLAQERAARSREELNGLYVAMTRAQRTLALSAVEPHRGAEASWWSRLADSAQARPAPPPALHGGAAKAGDIATLPQLPPAPPPGPARPTAAPAVDDHAARLGEALHRVLEWHGNRPGSAHAQLVQQAVAAFGLPDSAQRGLLAQVQAVLQGPQAAAFFDTTRLAWAGNEVSLHDGEDLVRLDRLVAFDEAGVRTWWVLDYKLQSAPLSVPAYVQQLSRYRDLLRRLQPADRVRAAFVTAAGEVLEIAEG
jgi:ATP-dependent helicase/nuclease subunit A